MLRINLSMDEACDLGVLLTIVQRVDENTMLGIRKDCYKNINQKLDEAIDENQKLFEALHYGRIDPFEPGRIYQHFQGGFYQIVGKPEHLQEKEKDNAWYICLDTKCIYIESKHDFCSGIEVDGKQIPRFKPDI